MDPAEQRFADYLDVHGYDWLIEPDYQEEPRLQEPVAVSPDFLVTRNGIRAICEVKHFETTAFRDTLSQFGGYMSTGSEVILKPIPRAFGEKADHIRPFAGAGGPLAIVLANPLGADVILDADHVIAAMVGNPSVQIPIDPATGGAPEGVQGVWSMEDHGAFRSLVSPDSLQRANIASARVRGRGRA